MSDYKLHAAKTVSITTTGNQPTTITTVDLISQNQYENSIDVNKKKEEESSHSSQIG